MVRVKVHGYFVLDFQDEEDEKIAMGRAKQLVLDRVKGFNVEKVEVVKDGEA